MSGKRITIRIPGEDKLWLEAYSKVHRVSVAEAIRQGIDLLKKRERQKIYIRLVESTCGIWKNEDGLTYQRKMRNEWE